MARTDEQIKMDILDQLYWDSRIDASKVQVGVDDGSVTLTGEVPAYRDLDAARSAARRIAGVRDVSDSLTVAYASSAPLPTDQELQASIGHALKWDPVIDEHKISARMHEGRAALEGVVDAHWKKAYIEEKLAGIRGIVGMENRLTVVPTHRIDDEVIAADVVAAFKRDAMVPEDEVTVAVTDGVVTLTGTASHWAAIDAATADASRTLGVRDVHNHIHLAA